MANPAHESVTPIVMAAKPSAAFVVIDPETAKRWLDHNTRNRRLYPPLVALYARDITAGRWQITGEAIKFAQDGSLLDGQHRLAAIARAGLPVTTLVVRGLVRDSQTAMDTGRKRAASDALHIAGEKNTTTLAAAARIALGVETVGYDAAQFFKATTAEILDYVDRHSDLQEAADFAVTVARRMDCTPGVLGYAYWRLAAISKDAATGFFLAAANKVDLRDGDPVIALTNALAEARRSRRTLSHSAVLSGIFRAWNSRRDGRMLRLVKFNSSAGGIVPVPEPR